MKKAAAKKDSSSSSGSEDNEEMKTQEKKESKPQKESAPVDDGNDGKTELFVQGLSFDTDESSLRSFFSPYGELVKCKLLMSQGRSKGKAFIEFADHASARKALEGTNEQELDGRSIWVEFSGQAAGGYKPQG